MPRSPIRIQFRRSGGFAGIPLTAATSADQLPEGQAAELQTLLASAEAPHRSQGPGPGAAGADQFQYQLELDDGQRQRSFNWDETQVPDAVRPLLGALTRIARPG